MDQVRIGGFIAQLRREKGWTQEELGEQVGVTNKTVSRWENGNYMPSIEILTLLSKKFGVSLNELLEGRRLDDGEEFRAAADEKLADALKRPGERLRRWLERYWGFFGVTLVLALLFAGSLIGMLQYRQAHPEDVAAVGTFACRAAHDGYGYDGGLTWLYVTFDRDGKYYVFDAAGKRIEHGGYAVDGDVIALDGGEAVRWIVIKGKQIHDVAPWGGELLAYERVSDVPMFINCGPEDFEA